jgi:hypothetical protein
MANENEIRCLASLLVAFASSHSNSRGANIDLYHGEVPHPRQFRDPGKLPFSIRIETGAATEA